jgi:Mce-associated membrane protein
VGQVRRALVVCLLLVTVALAGAAVWAGKARDAAQAAEDDRRSAARAAAVHAVNLLSVDHRTVDDDMKRVVATSTGEEREEYARNEAALKKATVDNKVVQTGVLRATGLASMAQDRRTAEVLIVADAVIHWEDGRKAAPEERFYRWRMEVTKAGGAWLVSKAELVQ